MANTQKYVLPNLASQIKIIFIFAYPMYKLHNKFKIFSVSFVP